MCDIEILRYTIVLFLRASHPPQNNPSTSACFNYRVVSCRASLWRREQVWTPRPFIAYPLSAALLQIYQHQVSQFRPSSDRLMSGAGYPHIITRMRKRQLAHLGSGQRRTFQHCRHRSQLTFLERSEPQSIDSIRCFRRCQALPLAHFPLCLYGGIPPC